MTYNVFGGTLNLAQSLRFVNNSLGRCISNCVWDNLLIFISLVLNNFSTMIRCNYYEGRKVAAPPPGHKDADAPWVNETKSYQKSVSV